MSNPLEDLTPVQAIVESPEFEAVVAAVEALPPVLLIDDRVGAHLLALRTGARALVNTTFPGTEPEIPVDA